jgi:hypothetical protein
MLDTLRRSISKALANYLNQPRGQYTSFSVTPIRRMKTILRPADVLLIEGDTRISTAIKYLTQSTWSHAAFYVGDVLNPGSESMLIEADMEKGVIAVPLSTYRNFNTRICRPIGLTDEHRQGAVDFMMSRIGLQYDLKNVFDLARYLLPTPPVPVRWRRKMLALGSGDPTRAICSSLIAQAFQSIQYPILPNLRDRDDRDDSDDGGALWPRFLAKKIFEIRHHSLYTPRDFDLSPYFSIVKPTLDGSFDYQQLNWYEDPAESPPDNMTTQEIE